MLLLVVAAGSAVAAAPVYLHGIAAHPFPSYIDGEPPYEVDRYSAPWIAGGLALGGLAVLLLVVAVDLAVHRRGGRRASVTDGAPTMNPSVAERTVVHLLRHGKVHNPDGILYGRLPGYRLSASGTEMAVAAASCAGRS